MTKKKKVKAVDVIDKHGQYIRTYDEERHGKDFLKLAEEFVKENPNAPEENKGRKIVDHPYQGVTAVEVVNNETGQVVATFTEENDGVDFWEKALKRASRILNKKGNAIVGTVVPVK